VTILIIGVVSVAWSYGASEPTDQLLQEQGINNPIVNDYINEVMPTLVGSIVAIIFIWWLERKRDA
jgi:mannose/fructose/N-acetylgalactosamine-specific phosphotransferase system component IID